MLIYVKILLGVFLNKVTIQITCPIKGNIVNGCMVEVGYVNNFERISTSAWKRNEWLVPIHAKHPKSEVIIKSDWKI